MKKLFDPKLYLVTDRSFCGKRLLDDVVEEAVLGGVSLVQLREKNLPLADFTELARALVRKLRPLRIPLIINDSVSVAMASGADGVHLGTKDLSPLQAREILGPDAIIGLSIENTEQILRVRDWPLDYVAASPVFATPTKTDAASPLGLEGLKKMKSLTSLPVIAIGGIGLANLEAVLMAGADGVAVVSAILGSSDVRSAAFDLRQRIHRFEKGERKYGKEKIF